MKVVFQRVSEASVTVDDQLVSQIGAGALLLCGIEVEDTEADIAKMADKVVGMRIFSDENGKFNYSLRDVGGEVLAVSQFTLCANCSHGRRPDFLQAARPEKASPLFDLFVQKLRDAGIDTVRTGVFGAHMHVSLLNDGPVTLILDTDDWK